MYLPISCKYPRVIVFLLFLPIYSISGSPKVLKNNNKNFDVNYAKRVIKEVKQIGFRVRTSFIFDLPTTTKEDMEKTIEFILETEPDEIRGHFIIFIF